MFLGLFFLTIVLPIILIISLAVCLPLRNYINLQFEKLNISKNTGFKVKLPLIASLLDLLLGLVLWFVIPLVLWELFTYEVSISIYFYIFGVLIRPFMLLIKLNKLKQT
jgi:uncharacterized protein YqhQ